MEYAMPSWHQQRAGTPQLWHETAWTVYENAYTDKPSAIVRFTREEDARAYAATVPGCAVYPPAPATYTTAEQCQYCGNRWEQRRTIGTPRLDSVPCPACRKLV